MTVVNQINILDGKLKQNEAQYDLDRLAAKVSAYSSNNLDKYEYLTDDDLRYKPRVVKQIRFDYFPLSKFLNKRLKGKEKKEGPLKILKKIEDKTKEQPKAIKTDTKLKLDLFDVDLTPEAIALIKEIKR